MEPPEITPTGFNQGLGLGFGRGRTGERKYDLGHHWLSSAGNDVEEVSRTAYPMTAGLSNEIEGLGGDQFDWEPTEEEPQLLASRGFLSALRDEEDGPIENDEDYFDASNEKSQWDKYTAMQADDEDAGVETAREASIQELTADMFGRSDQARPLNQAWNVVRARDFSQTSDMGRVAGNVAPDEDESAESFITRLRRESRGNIEVRSDIVVTPDSELGDDLRQMFHCVKTATGSIAPGDYADCPIYGRKFRGKCMPYTGLSFDVLDEYDERQKARVKLWQEIQNAIRARESGASKSSTGEIVSPENSLFAIVHHCSLAFEAGVLHDKSLAKLGEATERAKADPGILRPYHWLLQTKIGSRRVMCHHLLNSVCRLANRAVSSSAANAMVWIVRGLLSAEHSLSYDEAMTYDEMDQKGMIPPSSGMDRESVRFSARMWDLGLGFPICGKGATPLYISAWKARLEGNRNRVLASFKALDDAIKKFSNGKSDCKVI